jgi:Transposase DNA-binding/Transposase Tn5 dimerisation domain
MACLDLAADLASEFAFCALGHKARTTRAVQLARALGRAPRASLLVACGGDVQQAKLGYDFLANPHVHHEGLLSGHVAQTLGRAAAAPVALLVQDTTLLDLSHLKATRGLGPVGDGRGRGLVVHTVLVLRPDTAEVLGVLDQQVWARPERAPKGSKGPKEPARPPESERWTDAIERTAPLLDEHAPGVRRLRVADREADIFAFFARCRAAGEGFVVRLAQDRRVDGGEGPQVPEVEQKLKAQLAAAPVLGERWVELPAQPGRAARRVRLVLRACALRLRPPERGPERSAEPVALTALLAEEAEPPADGSERVRWVLGTSEPVTSEAEAAHVLGYYELRWVIEDFHMGCKSGCALEERQFETRASFEAFLALATVIAARALGLRQRARQAERAPATAALSGLELGVLRGLLPKLPPEPTARQAYRAVAQLGGFWNRKGDGEPGWRTLYRGMERLLQAVAGAEALLASPDLLAAKKELPE